MNLTLVGGTEQQRAWVNEAFRRTPGADWDGLIDGDVTFVWDEDPPCPGHKESACTQVDGSGAAIVTIRSNLDDPEAWPDGKLFYVETVVHELGHILTFLHIPEPSREAMCEWFVYDGGEGDRRVGAAEDLNPLDKPWADRIQECMAEIIKDAYLAEEYRAADNRTNWRLDPARYEEFMSNFAASGSGGEEHIFSSSTLTAHVPPETADLGSIISVGWLSQLPGGQSYTLRFRFGRGDGGFEGWRDYPPIVVPEGMVLEGHSEPAFPDVGGGSTVAIWTSYIIWDNVDIETVVSTPLETILTEDPEALGFWRQWSFLVAAEESTTPPWPYTDPELRGGGGDVGIYRL